MLLRRRDRKLGPLASSRQDAKEGGNGVAIGDYDGDGALDLAISVAFGVLDVLQGAGDGSFGAPQPFAVGDYAVAVASADVDGDHRTDLATVNGMGGDVVILRHRARRR